MVKDVHEQFAHTLIVINTPGGCDRASVENASSLRTFPVDDFGDCFIVADSLFMSFCVVVDNRSRVTAAGDSDDSFRFGQLFDGWIGSCALQG